MEGNIVRKDTVNLKCFNLIDNPQKFFNQILNKPKVLIPILFILISNLLFSYLILPNALERYFLQGHILNNVEISFLKVFSITASTFMGLFNFLIICILFYFIGHLFRSDLKFRSVVSVLGFVSIPKGFQLIQNGFISLYTGKIPESGALGFLLDIKSNIGKVLINNIDVFNIWYYFLFVVAVSVLFKISYTKSGIIIFILFILNTLIQLNIPQAMNI